MPSRPSGTPRNAGVQGEQQAAVGDRLIIVSTDKRPLGPSQAMQLDLLQSLSLGSVLSVGDRIVHQLVLSSLPPGPTGSCCGQVRPGLRDQRRQRQIGDRADPNPILLGALGKHSHKPSWASVSLSGSRPWTLNA